MRAAIRRGVNVGKRCRLRSIDRQTFRVWRKTDDSLLCVAYLWLWKSMLSKFARIIQQNILQVPLLWQTLNPTSLMRSVVLISTWISQERDVMSRLCLNGDELPKQMSGILRNDESWRSFVSPSRGRIPRVLTVNVPALSLTVLQLLSSFTLETIGRTTCGMTKIKSSRGRARQPAQPCSARCSLVVSSSGIQPKLPKIHVSQHTSLKIRTRMLTP